MALWRDWSVGIQAGVTTLTINHRQASGGFIVMATNVRMNATVRIGHDQSDITELDGYLSSQWSDGVVFQVRENLRNASETPDFSVASVRTATIPVLGPENIGVQIQ